jgi:2-polyprenyl-3-methyl-5-hydroxy-6-metoxy-1,4-benzoquinol methylase
MSFERLEPGTSEWTAYFANHSHRYSFAADQLSSLQPTARVLDAATGVGYGAAHISDVCGVQVVGVDRDASALGLARTHYQRPTIRFEQDDCTTLQGGACRAAPFDAAVSLETIEHLQAPERFLARLGDLLAPGALLIVSTPNRTVTDSERGRWLRHEREYTASEFASLIGAAGFHRLRLFGQRLNAIGLLRRDLRGELNRIRFNPLVRVGFWLQQQFRGISPEPVLPERLGDFEIVPLNSAEDCERQGSEGPFVLIATAVRP